ncbi:hypothetical protein [Streptomyces sp. A30]|uniref:hypothetical protein n=1 Tax=Streptomyces sp. A30 TaxID=2789273 RepID=UPI0039818F56
MNVDVSAAIEGIEKFRATIFFAWHEDLVQLDDELDILFRGQLCRTVWRPRLPPAGPRLGHQALAAARRRAWTAPNRSHGASAIRAVAIDTYGL